jgi:hypothetical protein
MKVKVKLHVFLTSALDVSDQFFVVLPFREKALGIHYSGD